MNKKTLRQSRLTSAQRTKNRPKPVRSYKLPAVPLTCTVETFGVARWRRSILESVARCTAPIIARTVSDWWIAAFQLATDFALALFRHWSVETRGGSVDSVHIENTLHRRSSTCDVTQLPTRTANTATGIHAGISKATRAKILPDLTTIIFSLKSKHNPRARLAGLWAMLKPPLCELHPEQQSQHPCGMMECPEWRQAKHGPQLASCSNPYQVQPRQQAQ